MFRATPRFYLAIALLCASGATVPSANAQDDTTVLVDRWNAAPCSWTNDAVLSVDQDIHLSQIELKMNWSSPDSSMPYRLTANGTTVVRGVLNSGSCDADHLAWCVGTADPEVDLVAGQYEISVGELALCANDESGGTLLRALGKVLMPHG